MRRPHSLILGSGLWAWPAGRGARGRPGPQAHQVIEDRLALVGDAEDGVGVRLAVHGSAARAHDVALGGQRPEQGDGAAGAGASLNLGEPSGAVVRVQRVKHLV